MDAILAHLQCKVGIDTMECSGIEGLTLNYNLEQYHHADPPPPSFNPSVRGRLGMEIVGAESPL